MADWTDVAPVEALAPGSRKVVDVDDVQVAVFNLDGSLHAIEDICTHDGCPLGDAVVKGDEITCPRHGARFNLKTGQALSAPAYEPLPVLPVRIENGMVQVRDDRWD